MDFDDDVGLDTSQIRDRRGLGIPLVGGGGIIGVIALLYTLFTGDSSALNQLGLQPGQTDQRSNLAAECQRGIDADNKADCRIVGVVNSVQAHWQKNFPNYRPAQTTFFTGVTQSACGVATANVGPFYCPVDQSVYIDLSFYDDLRNRFGATGGPFAEAYVIAHEYGHHIENQLGLLGNSSSNAAGANGGAVRIELMADCLAGAWAKGATSTGFIKNLTEQDIADGLDAAAAVGDDRIQEQARGTVDKESWTHGSAEQRQRWFTIGFQRGTVQGCDTRTVKNL